MNKRLNRLTLSRETLRRLDDPALRKVPGAALAETPINPDSPLCGPTYWETCAWTA